MERGENLLFKSLPPLAVLFVPPTKVQTFFCCFKSESFTYLACMMPLVGIDFTVNGKTPNIGCICKIQLFLFLTIVM